MASADETRTLIGRMLMVGVRGGAPGDPLLEADIEACAKARVGGVALLDMDLPTGGQRNIFDPAQVKTLTAYLRKRLGDGLLIGIDQEGGRVARLVPERGFAPHVSAAAFAMLDDAAQRELARAQTRQLADLGINLNFAPCVDVNTNPACPVIGRLGRSFAGDPDAVTRCARVWLDAHREAGVAACLKHFPGHGSSRDDSHAALPDITRTYDAQREPAPYRALAREAPMVMTGHLLDARTDHEHPASLSRAHTTGLLRTALGFAGVVVTDSLDMGAITARYPPDDALTLAVNAGADILLDCNNAPGAARDCPALAMAQALERALNEGRIAGGLGRLRASAARIAAL